MALEPNDKTALAADEPYTTNELAPAYIIDDALIEDNRLGQLLVRSRLLSHDQLRELLAEQMHQPGRLLGELVIERELATVEDIQNALSLQLSEMRLGQILVKTGCVAPHQLELALSEQELTGELLGSVLIGFGFASPEQISWAIDQQNKD